MLGMINMRHESHICSGITYTDKHRHISNMNMIFEVTNEKHLYPVVSPSDRHAKLTGTAAFNYFIANYFLRSVLRYQYLS